MEEERIADGGRDDTGSLSDGFFGDDFCGNEIIGRIEVRDRFVEEDEIERHTEGADDSEPLLLTDRHFTGRIVASEGNTEAFEPFIDATFGDMAGKVILKSDILDAGEFGEKVEFLREICDVGASELLPAVDGEPGYGIAVEEQAAFKIASRTIDICHKRRFAATGWSLDEIVLTAMESTFREPYFGVRDLLTDENFG